jgi:hypothetical protein
MKINVTRELFIVVKAKRLHREHKRQVGWAWHKMSIYLHPSIPAERANSFMAAEKRDKRFMQQIPAGNRISPFHRANDPEQKHRHISSEDSDRTLETDQACTQSPAIQEMGHLGP